MSPLTSLLARVHPRVFALLAGAAVLLTAAGAAFVVAAPGTSEVSLSVPDGAGEVALDRQLILTFTHPVPEARLAAAFRVDPPVEGDLRLAGSAVTATFTPTGRWADLTDYRITLNAFRDASGAQLRAHSWRFRTTIVPRVTAVQDEAGKALTESDAVPLGSGLTILFNAAMDSSSVRMTVNARPAGLSWLPEGRKARLPTAGLSPGPLELALGDGRDQAGHRAASGYRLGLTLQYVNPEKTVPLRYPALVQVDNVAAARDQSGLQSADLVFEYQTEGGITRFSALFTHAPSAVGPVRSGRYVSFKLVRHYHGALYLSGLSLASTRRLAADRVPVFLDAPYYRSRDRLAPENLYIAGDGIQQSELLGTPAPYAPPQAAPQLPATASPAATLAVTEHYSTYSYDVASATYSKTEENHLFADALVKQTLRIEMVVVIHTREWVTADVEDVDGAHARDFDTESSGRADFYYHGRTATGTWSGTDRSNPFTFKLATGEALTLPHGLTWIDIVGS